MGGEQHRTHIHCNNLDGLTIGGPSQYNIHCNKLDGLTIGGPSQ